MNGKSGTNVCVRNIVMLALLGMAVGYLGVGFWEWSRTGGMTPRNASQLTMPTGVPTADLIVIERGPVALDNEVSAQDMTSGTVPVQSNLAAASDGDGRGMPILIMIPRVGVEAAVEHVSVTAAGYMDVPRSSGNVGWYALGPRPGDVGSAVIAGHVAWFDGATAVFADLHKVAAGDTIFVRNDDGSDETFVVREVRIYPADAIATEVFVSTDGKAHLNLITCIGDWDGQARQYAERLVVFADQET